MNLAVDENRYEIPSTAANRLCTPIGHNDTAEFDEFQHLLLLHKILNPHRCVLLRRSVRPLVFSTNRVRRTISSVACFPNAHFRFAIVFVTEIFPETERSGTVAHFRNTPASRSRWHRKSTVQRVCIVHMIEKHRPVCFGFCTEMASPDSMGTCNQVMRFAGKMKSVVSRVNHALPALPSIMAYRCDSRICSDPACVPRLPVRSMECGFGVTSLRNAIFVTVVQR